jgi:hypothetical protein
MNRGPAPRAEADDPAIPKRIDAPLRERCLRRLTDGFAARFIIACRRRREVVQAACLTQGQAKGVHGRAPLDELARVGMARRRGPARRAWRDGRTIGIKGGFHAARSYR